MHHLVDPKCEYVQPCMAVGLYILDVCHLISKTQQLKDFIVQKHFGGVVSPFVFLLVPLLEHSLQQYSFQKKACADTNYTSCHDYRCALMIVG